MRRAIFRIMIPANWKRIAEIIGVAAIVASLIFVGLQMKQGHEIALAAQYQARAEAYMGFSIAGIEANWIIPPLRSHVNNEISARDISAVMWMWTYFDNNSFQYQSGFLTDEAWQALAKSHQDVYEVCVFRFVYDWRKSSLRPSVVALVDTWNDPCKAED